MTLVFISLNMPKNLWIFIKIYSHCLEKSDCKTTMAFIWSPISQTDTGHLVVSVFKSKPPADVLKENSNKIQVSPSQIYEYTAPLGVFLFEFLI